MKNLALAFLLLTTLTACGFENKKNEKDLHNLMVTAQAEGKNPHWVLWVKLKEFPRTPQRLDYVLDIFGMSGLHAAMLPRPTEVFETQKECFDYDARVMTRVYPPGGDSATFCTAVGYEF